VSKIENGTQRTTDADIAAWVDACGADARLTELIAANREIEFMWNDYRRLHRVGMKKIQAQSMDLFAQSRLIRVYESLFIPGFLQTFDYAVAQFTIHAKLHGLPVADVEEAAQNRMARKRYLGTGAPMFVFVLESSALANNTGGTAVMEQQLDYLLEVARLPYVSLGIIPEGRPRTLYPGEGFYLFDDSLLRQEFWSGAFRTSRADNVTYFARVFAALKDQAVFGAAAAEQIEAARRRLQAT
jgi:hypothetical protein